MRTDRELWELAAKAIGKELVYDECFGIFGYYDEDSEWHQWIPLDDDGDALRLAVNLEFNVDTSCMAHWGNNTDITDHRCKAKGFTSYGLESHVDDKFAATRRAIVRAAAEIGKSL
jgi:hypothetical protein